VGYYGMIGNNVVGNAQLGSVDRYGEPSVLLDSDITMVIDRELDIDEDITYEVDETSTWRPDVDSFGMQSMRDWAVRDTRILRFHVIDTTKDKQSVVVRDETETIDISDVSISWELINAQHETVVSTDHDYVSAYVTNSTDGVFEVHVGIYATEGLNGQFIEQVEIHLNNSQTTWRSLVDIEST
jgi:hypothetical protein